MPLWPLVLVTAVRNMAVDLVPARAGAAASYLYLITARLGLPLEAGVASFALAFILDTLAVARCSCSRCSWWATRPCRRRSSSAGAS